MDANLDVECVEFFNNLAYLKADNPYELSSI